MREFQSDSGKVLARFIADSKNQNKLIPILWLGAGCSVAAGCPTSADLLKRIKKIMQIDFKNNDELCDIITGSHHKLLTNRFIKSDSTSIGYWLLAQLIAKDYFKIILTTNWDFLLENHLRVVLPYNRLQFYTRPEDDDPKIVRALKQFKFDADNILVIHLHGDLRSKLISSTGELLDFDDSLTFELKSIIENLGLIFIGTSYDELRLAKIIRKKDEIWSVNPILSNSKFLKTFGIKSTQHITGEDALFDNFMQGICSIAITEELSDRILMKEGKVLAKGNGDQNPRETIDTIVSQIDTFLRTDSINDDDAVHLTRALLKRIEQYVERQQKGKACLIFVEDPEAPGGREMLILINRIPELNKLVENFKIFKAIIKKSPRGLDKLDPTEDLDEFETVILVDDISFTGNTLIRLKKDLIKRQKANEHNFVAALLRIDAQSKDNLENKKWHVEWSEIQNGFGVMFPWGFVRPTKAFLKDGQKHFLSTSSETIKSNDFKAHTSFGYIPKPWGELAIIRENSFSSSRIFSIERGKRTSLHYHLFRDEIFLVLDNRLCVCLWDRFVRLHRHQSIRIPAGVPHCIIALENTCRVLEIGEGYYNQRCDIVRIYDPFNRKLSGFGDDGII